MTIEAKVKMLGKLAESIGKKTPRDLKNYLQNFKGTDEEYKKNTGEEDVDLVKNIKKSYKKKN